MARQELARAAALQLRQAATEAHIPIPLVQDLDQATTLVRGAISHMADVWINTALVVADVLLNERWHPPHDSFVQWVKEDLGRSGSWGYDIVAAARVLLRVQTSGPVLDQSHAIELARAPEEMWEELAPNVARRSVRAAREYVRSKRDPDRQEESADDALVARLGRIAEEIMLIEKEDLLAISFKKNPEWRSQFSDLLSGAGNYLIDLSVEVEAPDTAEETAQSMGYESLDEALADQTIEVRPGRHESPDSL